MGRCFVSMIATESSASKVLDEIERGDGLSAAHYLLDSMLSAVKASRKL